MFFIFFFLPPLLSLSLQRSHGSIICILALPPSMLSLQEERCIHVPPPHPTPLPILITLQSHYEWSTPLTSTSLSLGGCESAWAHFRFWIMPADLVAVLRVGVKRSAVPPFKLLMQKLFIYKYLHLWKQKHSSGEDVCQGYKSHLQCWIIIVRGVRWNQHRSCAWGWLKKVIWTLSKLRRVPSHQTALHYLNESVINKLWLGVWHIY